MFEQEVRQRKSLVPSSRRKKCGSKSKKCTLPSDFLTEKQIRERHGETIVYNLKQPMTWENFKKLPGHAQSEYIAGLRENYGVAASDIAKMFGVTSQTVRSYMSEKNIEVRVNHGYRMSGRQRELWERFLSEEEQPNVPVYPIEEMPINNPSPETSDREENNHNEVLHLDTAMKMSEIKLRFDGDIDVNGVANTLRVVLGANTKGTVTITYQAGNLKKGGQDDES